MTSRNKMKCPNCGAEMNHHADKIDYSGENYVDPVKLELGGILKEVHSCPGCGETALRLAS